MSKDHTKANRALNALLDDDADLSIDELRAELSAQGVEVNKFLTGFSKTVRNAFQQRVRNEADKSNKDSLMAKAALFGDLARKTLSELLSIRDQVVNGAFGSELQKTAVARCRNQKGTDVSEDELRSWLEDISTSGSDQ